MRDICNTRTVELILKTCANEATIIRLFYTAGVSYYSLKKYLFYLIEDHLISYQAVDGVYVLTYEGWKLLLMIDRVEQMVN
jgi:predicted transcriptional regulator